MQTIPTQLDQIKIDTYAGYLPPGYSAYSYNTSYLSFGM